MHVLALRVDLRFPGSQSLKEKRILLKPIVDGIRNRFDVSVAEVGAHDTWQRCQIGVALVSGEVAVAEKLADQIERFIWTAADTEVLSIERRWADTD